jgi:hypothetical protein
LWIQERPGIAHAIFIKNKLGGYTFPDFKMCYKTVVNTTAGDCMQIGAYLKGISHVLWLCSKIRERLFQGWF